MKWSICKSCGWRAYPDYSRHRLPVADNHKPTSGGPR